MSDGAISVDKELESPAWSGCERSSSSQAAVPTLSEDPDVCLESTPHCVFPDRYTLLSGVSTTAPKLDDRAPLLSTIFARVSATLRKTWFWYSVAASLCWTGWAFTARLGSEEIPPATMQFVSAFGFLAVALAMVGISKPQLKVNLRGNTYALVSGILLGLGGIALYGAYRAGDNAAVVTATTSLYPVGTVILAVTFLREKLNKLQLLGVCFAVAAILMLST
jgi:transporter family protein